MKVKYLTKEQADILLKCYYLKGVSSVAKADKTTADKIRYMKGNGLDTIRLAYSQLFKQRLKYDGKLIIKYMAERSYLKEEDLTIMINQYIIDSLESDSSKRYWKRIRSKGEVPTADELLDFIYDKYEVNIEFEI